jgi:ATP-dependent DNA ligase
MTHLILTEARYAGHCTTGTSNKVWAACLAVEQDGDAHAVDLATLPETTEVVVLCGHGPYGAALRLEAPKRMTLQAGRTLLRKKWREKTGKGYLPVPFSPFVPSFGAPCGLPLLLPASPAASATDPGASSAESKEREDRPRNGNEPPRFFRHSVAPVKAISYDDLLAKLSEAPDGDPSRYTISEKANGERCLVEFDGTELRAYNRKGRLVSSPPEGARALCRLGQPFVVDGERFQREQAGHYVLFDVLEWRGEVITTLPYRIRMTRLVRTMQAAGLLKELRLTPTLSEARQNSTTPLLSVLLGVRGEEQARRVMREIQAAGGEGVILRSLDAPYHAGGFKYKFLEDLDAFVVGIEPGIAGGSLRLGLLRPADGAVIEVGHVRAGLNEAEVEQVRDLLAQGRWPVFRVRYLPASTIGITLAQPQTSMAWLREEKEARECHTDQLGAEKAHLIAAARPLAGLSV